jgi:uncharacterized protein (TIGR03435 family)
MNKLVGWSIALAAVSLSPLRAQSLTGTWQGSLQPPQGSKELRIVIKISTTPADTLKALLYSIDQGSQSFASSAVTVQGSAVKITFPGVGGTYEGKLSADGNTIAGSWAQGPKPIPLSLERATSETAWAIPEPPAKLKPMRADADPVFEVATIKPSRPDAQGRGFRVNGRSFSTMNTSLSDLISFAYGIQKRQISGAPSWAEADHYDLSAKPEGEGVPNSDQLKIMMRKLVADRFQLKFHRDKKEMAVYTLNVAKTGAKLTKSEADPNGLPGLGFRGLGAFIARNATLGEFATVMQTTALDRPVLDQTGLPGRYDFTLNWAPDEFQFQGLGIKPAVAADANSNPDLFTAIQQQLGLKLESAKAPAEILVIDHVEKPSEN